MPYLAGENVAGGLDEAEFPTDSNQTRFPTGLTRDLVSAQSSIIHNIFPLHVLSSNLHNRPLGDVLPSPPEETMTRDLSSQWLARCSQDSLSSILG